MSKPFSSDGPLFQDDDLESAADFGPEYEDFLYAVVCNEKNGMQLTMNSAIARTGADPWAEAARISKMPLDHARRVLTLLVPEAYARDGKGLDRLFSLLPNRKSIADTYLPTSDKVAARRMANLSAAVVFAFTAAVMFTCVLASGSHTGPNGRAAQYDASTQPKHPII